MNEKQNPITKESGFTILELLIATVLLAIGAAVSAWGVNLVLPEMHLKQGARDLRSDLQMMRLQAIRQNTTLSLVLDTGNDNYVIFEDLDGDGDVAGDSSETVLKRVDMPRHVTLSASTFPVAGNGLPRLRFGALGTTDDGGNVTLTNTRASQRVLTCSVVGQVQIATTIGSGSGGSGGSGGGPSGP